MNLNSHFYDVVAEKAWGFGIGLTPILPIKVNDRVTVYAKLEAFNRFKSVKDRAAFFMIQTAIEQGTLDKTKTLIEASSGNTGIAVASIATALGYSAEIYVPEASSSETVKTLKATGARITEVSDEYSRNGKINIDAALKMIHRRMLDEPEKYINLDQYSNYANTYAHVHTTGPEIVSSLNGICAKPNIFVTGIGTGGTITGMATFMKEMGNGCRIYGAQPDPEHHIQGLKNLKVSSVPPILSSRMDLIGNWIEVDDRTAYEGIRRIAEYGYFAGISSGANFMAALKIASSIDSGNIITIFPDSAEKYRSVLTSRGVFTENEYDLMAESLLGIPDNALKLSADQVMGNA